MRLIDADALKAYLFENCADGKDAEEWYTIMGIDDGIDNAPTIDAEQVVRCKDCKWWIEYSSNLGTAMFCDHDCSLGGQGIKKANDYCSYGERKDND